MVNSKLEPYIDSMSSNGDERLLRSNCCITGFIQIATRLVKSVVSRDPPPFLSEDQIGDSLVATELFDRMSLRLECDGISAFQ